MSKINDVVRRCSMVDYVVFGAFLIGNFFYSVAKKSLPVSFSALKSSLKGATTKAVGNMYSQFALAYGLSKVLGGLLSDLLPPHILFIGGLGIGSLLNMLISYTSNVKSMKFYWTLNGFFQGAGGPALSKVVVRHLPPSYRASVWSYLTLVRPNNLKQSFTVVCVS
jgi:sugar phosphate permease